jgi:hypothetical protein
MRFQAGDVAGLTDERTISQLASILYEHDARGRGAIETKENARKRGVKSHLREAAVKLNAASEVTIKVPSKVAAVDETRAALRS